MDLGTGATVENLTEELYLSIKDGSGHVKSAANLANFIRFASQCKRQRRHLLFKIVDVVVHAANRKSGKTSVSFPETCTSRTTSYYGHVGAASIIAAVA